MVKLLLRLHLCDPTYLDLARSRLDNADGMSPDPADAIASLHQQLRRVLDEQISSLTQQYEAAVAEARGRATADAEEAALARIATAREEFEQRLAGETAARTDAERKLVAETTRLRMEAEQQAAESTARVREELEHALAAERQRAEQAVQAERQRGEMLLDAERKRADVEIQKARENDARVTEREAGLACFDRLLGGIHALDAASSLTAALDALLTHAAAATSRAALFLVNGDRLKSWKTVGFPQLDAQPFESSIAGSGLLAHAVLTATPVASGEGQPAPTFAAVPADRIGLAVPVVVGGRAVALLYADNVGPIVEVPAAWPEEVETLVSHASAVLALLTASRTLQALGGANGSHAAAASAADGDEQGARRYARLLVSEIKLYNEGAVRVGREKRDLLARLRSEIDRARRMYEERVPPAVAARGLYFQQELVQTLAGGDPGLLGNP